MCDASIVPNIRVCYNVQRKGACGMPTSKAQQKAVAKYMAANYDEIKVRVPKGRKESIQAHAAISDGGSVNAFINRAIKEAMQREGT